MDQEIMLALEQFTFRATVPLLYDDAGKLDQLGTGTLFFLQGRYFLVTASHTFERKDAEKFAIPKNPKGSDVQTLGRLELFRPDDKNIDIAVLELQEPDTIAYVKGGWKLLGMEHTALPSDSGTFLLCGYPSNLVIAKGESLGGRLLTAYTERLREIPVDAKRPVVPDLDIFLNHSKRATRSDGTEVDLPQLRGMSGAAVWEYREPRDELIWTPENALRIVGIQSDVRVGDYVRAKNWRFVRELFTRIVPSLAD